MNSVKCYFPSLILRYFSIHTHGKVLFFHFVQLFFRAGFKLVKVKIKASFNVIESLSFLLRFPSIVLRFPICPPFSSLPWCCSGVDCDFEQKNWRFAIHRLRCREVSVWFFWRNCFVEVLLKMVSLFFFCENIVYVHVYDGLVNILCWCGMIFAWLIILLYGDFIWTGKLDIALCMKNFAGNTDLYIEVLIRWWELCCILRVCTWLVISSGTLLSDWIGIGYSLSLVHLCSSNIF